MFVRARAYLHPGGREPQEIWSGETRTMAAGAKNLPPTRADLEQFTALGEHLGYLDVDMQERTLLLYLEQLDLSIEYLQGTGRKKMPSVYQPWRHGRIFRHRHVLTEVRRNWRQSWG